MSETVPPAAFENASIASLWRRFFAFACDIIVLGLPVLIIGLIFFSWACSLGPSGALIGFALSLIYFSIFNSHIGGGQTPGEWLLDIRVIDRNGGALALKRAFIRTLIFTIPAFLNNRWIPPTTLPWLDDFVGIILVFLVFGLGGAILYLFIFNRRTRQSLHDLAAGSFVVRGSALPIPAARSTPRLHLRIATCWLALCLALPLAGSLKTQRAASSPAVQQLTALQSALKAQLGLTQTRVTTFHTRFWSSQNGAQTIATLNVIAEVRPGKENIEAQTRAVAAAVLRLSPDLLGEHILTVQVRRGFDLGVASWSIGRNESHDAPTWRQKLSA